MQLGHESHAQHPSVQEAEPALGSQYRADGEGAQMVEFQSSAALKTGHLGAKCHTSMLQFLHL